MAPPSTTGILMAFRILGLDPSPFMPLYGLPSDELARRGVRRLVVDASPGFPDRVEVRDAAPGETVLLLNHVHQPADTPFRASHAIFVRENVEPVATVDEMPPALRRRLLALRAFDAGQITDDVKLRQIVEPVLTAGSLAVASAQVPFVIRDGRLRISATTLDAKDARAIVSGGYDIPADQADIRASLITTTIGNESSRPEIQLFVVGTPDGLQRSVDVTSLSSWLAVRAIDRETRRLDAIARGEPPPSYPSSTASLPLPPGAGSAPPSSADVPMPGRDPRRVEPRAKPAGPRQQSSPQSPLSASPPGSPPLPVPPVAANQQIAPLPPPVEIKPAPGALPPRPRPALRPPLVLTPPGSP
jgi:hypothetical protein